MTPRTSESAMGVPRNPVRIPALVYAGEQAEFHASNVSPKPELRRSEVSNREGKHVGSACLLVSRLTKNFNFHKSRLMKPPGLRSYGNNNARSVLESCRLIHRLRKHPTSQYSEATMTDRMQYSESDPRHHAAKLKDMLTAVVDHARQDVGKVNDPKAQVLFETTAEVLLGLRKAYEDFERGSEPAWRKAS